MAQIGVPDYAEYLDYLQVHPEEFTALFNTILINVTGFFRDAEAWEHLRTEVLPTVLAQKDVDAPVRVWSAGCASGEEAYSLAIMMVETLGPDQFSRRVKIYATDVDEEGLTQARHASYSERDVRGLPPELLERYFETSGNRYTFRQDLRRSVIFGRNDLVQDAPTSRIDLLVCRNALMYFNAETQARILSRLHFALAPGGVLFLGKAEMLLSHANLFIPIDLKRRLFRKVVPPPANGNFLVDTPQPTASTDLIGLDRLRSEAFTASPVAQVVATADGLVALTNRQAQTMFGVSPKDIGRPFRDLDLSYHPVELRGYIEQAQVERRPSRVSDIEYVRSPGEVLHLEVQINPLVDTDASLLGVALIFLDVTAARQMHDELEHANRQLQTAYEELQSTNEELETMNEELQSTNDELQTINDELRERTAELDNAKVFLEAILTSLRAGVAVVNRDMHVRMWNRRAEDLWGLRQDEAVGQHFLNLDIGLPTNQLRPMIRQVLTGDGAAQEVRLSAVNRRGRTVEVRVTGTPLYRDGEDTTGAILVMDIADGTVDGGVPAPVTGYRPDGGPSEPA